MSRRCRGFGLIELMIAITLGLIVVLGITQIFVAAKSTYSNQNTAAGMQEDARFILGKMVQEIRMVGMFGCLTPRAIDTSAAADFATLVSTPITWSSASHSLTLVTADIGGNGGTPAWTIISDCLNTATAVRKTGVPAAGQMAFPLRRQIYALRNNQITVSSGDGPAAGLVSNVRSFGVSFGIAPSATAIAVSSYSSHPADPATIRSVRLQMTLYDPNGQVADQQYSVVAALRNRLL
ncbi:PilW family protein [Pseudomonas batumici]|uniref:Type IV fimbrial biogenesis protein PilW n=1 Tax=Pseudomonas batumici TaxID=226910 RepID=A0A0C2I3A9_9PSED|nr:prepilin-type N-terminal cleavage/methylation domain-containing protein [Pseudomonas batumici]KIH81460.1 Type IV fimbrial biogenesis protein PilW [Pseudomonas batumici]